MKNDLQTAVLALKERSDTEVFFKKYFKIRDRESSEIIPFEINESQRKLKDIIDKWEKTPDREMLVVIILKARRQGFSTYSEADFFKRILYEKHKTAMVISFDDDSAKNINDMADIFYQYLPANMKPDRRPSRGNGVILENPKYDPTIEESPKNRPGLQSKFLVETASNMNAGSSYNIHYLHISELAKYKGDVPSMMTSLLQAVPNQNSIVIIESTALGYNHFKDVWDEANRYIVKGKRRIKKNSHITLFIPWYEDKKSVRKYTGFELTDYEEEIKKVYNLTNAQLTWRRWCIQNKCGGRLNTFMQEYPISPKEAFIATGASVFENEKVDLRITVLEKRYAKKPPDVGMFHYTIKGGMIDDRSIRFIKNKNGLYTIYKHPQKGYPYVLSGDTAGEGSDQNTQHVLDNTNGMQMAVLHGHMDSDLYAEQAYCAGKYYNEAMIALEMNFDIAPIKRLQVLMYWNLYKREIADNAVDKQQEKYGFQTTSITRPLIINNLVTIVRDNIEWINDIPTLEEMLEFAYNKARKPIANSGKHDDLIMGLAIGYHCASQMWTTIDDTDDEAGEDDEDYDEDDVNPNTPNWMAD